MRYGALLLIVGAGLAACGADPSSSPTAPPGTLDPVASPEAPPPSSSTTPPVTAASCARADLAHTAPASLFDTFKTDIASADPSVRAAKVDTFLAAVAAAGGTPLEDPKTGRTIFLARGAGAWSVVGSFVGWDEAKALSLAAIDGTDLAFVDTTIATGQSHAYKLLSGGTYLPDPRAKNVVWDGIDHHTVGEFNAIAHPADQPKDKGRIEYAGKVHATKLANDRDVFVYVPASYDAAVCKNLPIVLIHDGNESLTRGDFVGAADTLYAARPELSSILVFIALASQNDRMAEYTFDDVGTKGDAYVDFVIADLMPKLTTGYHVCAKPGARGISGASLGGLISTYAAFEKPGVFGWVGAQSPSFFWADNALIDEAKTAPVIPTRFYLDSGEPDGACGEADNCAIVDTMEQTLQSKGYQVERVKQMNADHDWPFWRDRLPGMLTNFRDAQTICD